MDSASHCFIPPALLSSLCFALPTTHPQPSPFLVSPIASLFFTCFFSHSPYFSLLNVSVLSLSCLLLTSHRLPFEILLFSHHFLFSLPLSFSIPGTAFSSHTFIPTFLTPPPLSSALILHHFGIPRLSLVSSFHPSILLACFLSSFLPDSFSSSQTNGGKYGNVSVTRQEIREDCVNMAGLSQPHQHNVWVRMHIMWVLKT